jgi:thiol-disulfide isomerase/thioredoxin
MKGHVARIFGHPRTVLSKPNLRNVPKFLLSRANMFTIVLLAMALMMSTASPLFNSNVSNAAEIAAYAPSLETSPDSGIESISSQDKATFMYFYSETCPYCQKQEPIIGELEDEYGQSITFVHIGVQDNREAMGEFNVSGVPTMILEYGEDSRGQDEYYRFEGLTDKMTLGSLLAKLTGAQSEPGASAIGKAEGKDEAPGQNKEPGEGTEDETSINSCSLPPLSSALHVLPPLVNNNEKATLSDQTLADFVQVTICQINGDQCIPVSEFTSQKISNGLDYIKLQNKFYHVNWNISKADSGKTFEIHFSITGLDIGKVTYVPKNGETIPIRFYVDSHPITRARVLHEQGYSSMEIAEALSKEFNLGAGNLALVLKNALGLPALEVAQTLLALGFGPTEITIAQRCAYELDAYNAGLVLKALGFNEYTIQSVLIEVHDVYAAIVDITSTVNNDPAQGPSGYTGLAFCNDATRSTEPYIPGLFGKFVTPSDINKGIGGDFRYVYVKYELVSKTSDTPVVTGIKAAHWPYWDEPFPCGAGWTAVSRLTSGTLGDCDRIGMCALYEPFKDAEKFITNAAISFGDFGNPASKCSAVGGSNANIWPLYTDTLDIHRGCEDEHWVFFCYNQAQAWTARPATIEVSDDEKLALLEQYAPRVFLHPSERFYPSSVEWSFDHLFRYSPNDLPPWMPTDPFLQMLYHLFPPPDNKYYVAPKEMIGAPSDWLEYHYGCNGSATDSPCQLSDAPAYAFYNKQTIPWGGEEIEVVDLTYFFYYPYNRGKEYFDTIWGSHVGDWEKTTVRLSWVYNPSTGWEIKPIHLFVSAHDFGTSHPWDEISKVPGSDHPIVYSAEGSHGNYVTAGRQRYGKIVKGGITLAFLYDYTGEGAQWNTWTNLETFDYDGEHGLGSSTWPRWMSTVYTAPCAPDNPGCDPYEPSSGPIYRWGIYEFGSCDIECRMAKGPTGPVDKGIWNNPYEP